MSTTPNIFERLWAWITGEVKQIPTIEDHIITFADNVVNELKTLQASGVVKFIETGIASIAEAINPALTPLIAGIENYIPKVLNLVTGIVDTATTEASKPVTQQISDGLAQLQKIKGVDASVYAGLLGTVQTALSNYVLTNNAVAIGSVAPPIGHQLAVGQIVHAQNAPAA